MTSEEERDRHQRRLRRKALEKKEFLERKAEKKGAFSLKENRGPEYKREKLKVRDIFMKEELDD